MVRLTGRDVLDDVRGRLGIAFHAVTLSALHSSFVTEAGTKRQEAEEALAFLYQTAKELLSREREFNSRAHSGLSLSLMSRLRSPAQLAALREFSTARESLLAFSPAAGNIIRLVEKEFAAPGKTPARQNPVHPA